MSNWSDYFKIVGNKWARIIIKYRHILRWKCNAFLSFSVKHWTWRISCMFLVSNCIILNCDFVEMISPNQYILGNLQFFKSIYTRKFAILRCGSTVFPLVLTKILDLKISLSDCSKKVVYMPPVAPWSLKLWLHV